MKENLRFNIYILILFAVFTLVIGIAGYFNIGLLSDDYLNINGSIHSSFTDKLTGNLPFTNSYHLRTAYYLSMQSSSYLHDMLGFSYDNFVLYRIQNLILYLLLAYMAGRILLHITSHLSVSVLTSLVIIIFPNNINNICWTAARVDLLCGIFYLFAVYFSLKYVTDDSQTSFLSALLAYAAALFTKETALSIPIITSILIIAFYGKEILLKKKMLIIVELILIVIYVFYKIVILGNNLGTMATLYQSSPLANAPGILARAAIALTMPLDFLTLNLSLRDKDLFLMIYLLSLYGALFYIISVMFRNDIYRYIGYMLLSLGVLLLPNIYIGYIRTQMILIPFIILTLLFFWAYDHQIKNNIRINKNLLKVFFGIALIYWGYNCYANVSDWKYSYSTAKSDIHELINSNYIKSNHNIIIGNPGRYKQAFLFDKLTGAYNYWKNKEFAFKDTINDIVQTGALDKESLTSKIKYVQLQPNEFEITATGSTQYFYMEGFDNEKIKEGFRNADMQVEFSEFNILNKPTKLRLKINNPAASCYLASELKFTKL